MKVWFGSGFEPHFGKTNQKYFIYFRGLIIRKLQPCDCEIGANLLILFLRTCRFIFRRGVSTLTNPFTRGSAPDRARSADRRPGSFKPGHEKRGGRKRGTPNLFTIDHKKAILEATYRIGQDGDGKDGVLGI